MKKVILSAVSIMLFLLAGSVNAADYNWGSLLGNNDAWFSGAEAAKIGDSIVKYQLSDGGWRKAMDDTGQTGEWAKSTTDNDATTSQLHFLARLFKATNTTKYRTSCEKGIDLLINGQYSNGGWPQIFSASSGSYHTHITFNDGAMVRLLDIMKAVSEKSGNFTFIDNTRAAKAKTAMDKGVDVILQTQIVFSNGTKTAWCQQHDRTTLAPATARAYELPSVSGSESVGIVDFLKKYHSSLGSNPRADIVQAINAAVTWMTNVRIVGYAVENITTNGAADRRLISSSSKDTLWARFYELNTNKPMFVGRDGVKKYNMADIEQERRAGYAWYGTWPRNLVRAGLITVPSSSSTARSSSSIAPSSSSMNPVNIGSGNFIDNLILFDLANATAWAINGDFKAGAKLFGDREFLAGSPIPEILRGAEWVSTSMLTRTLTAPSTIAQFKMKKAGVVYILHEDRVTTKPGWLASSGFTSTGKKVTVTGDSQNRTFTIYSKKFESGATVSLGPNSNDGTTSTMMYLVAVTNEPGTTLMLGNTLLVKAGSPTVVGIYNLKGEKMANHRNLPHGVYFAKIRGMQSIKFVVK